MYILRLLSGSNGQPKAHDPVEAIERREPPVSKRELIGTGLSKGAISRPEREDAVCTLSLDADNVLAGNAGLFAF